MSSLWSLTAPLPAFPTLDRDLNTSVLVIGGGLCGLLCAKKLANTGVDCVLVEQNTICSGITRGTTAKLTSQHGLIYQKLVRSFGPRAARLYYEANTHALEEYRLLCRDMDCSFEECDSYIYSRQDPVPLEREMKALERSGIPARLTHSLPLPFPVAGAVSFSRQAKFHPLQFARAISKGLTIYENTPILELTPQGGRTDRHFIRAGAVVVCTHFPFLNKHGAYFLKLYQDRSYALALEGAGPLDGIYLDCESGGLSLRSWGNTLILGGGSHRTGKPSDAWATLSSLANRLYPGKKELCRWAAQDCMTLDGIPYIGLYSPNTPGLYVATGFNKWGMTSSMVAADILTDLITGLDNPFASLFSPRRSLLRPQLAANGWEAVSGLLSLKKPRCPHLGCALRWNRQEHSWDCPCHGSRFAEDGSRLDNPATGGLS